MSRSALTLRRVEEGVAARGGGCCSRRGFLLEEGVPARGGGSCPLATVRLIVWAAHSHNARAGPRPLEVQGQARTVRGAHAGNPTRRIPLTYCRWPRRHIVAAAVSRRCKPDTQKQRTSPSACARLSSFIAALACSGDWNMAPNRPGTCERLKNVSAAT